MLQVLNLLFRVKYKPNITNGFRHIYQMIKDAQDFFIGDNDGWEIFYERILNNSFFLNIGNIHKKRLFFQYLVSLK